MRIWAPRLISCRATWPAVTGSLFVSPSIVFSLQPLMPPLALTWSIAIFVPRVPATSENDEPPLCAFAMPMVMNPFLHASETPPDAPLAPAIPANAATVTTPATSVDSVSRERFPRTRAVCLLPLQRFTMWAVMCASPFEGGFAAGGGAGGRVEVAQLVLERLRQRAGPDGEPACPPARPSTPRPGMPPCALGLPGTGEPCDEPVPFR